MEFCSKLLTTRHLFKEVVVGFPTHEGIYDFFGNFLDWLRRSDKFVLAAQVPIMVFKIHIFDLHNETHKLVGSD